MVKFAEIVTVTEEVQVVSGIGRLALMLGTGEPDVLTETVFVIVMVPALVTLLVIVVKDEVVSLLVLEVSPLAVNEAVLSDPLTAVELGHDTLPVALN
jgi:hypothetical protein